MNVNAELDLNIIVNKLIGNTYGVVFLCLIGVFIIIVVSIYFIAKSGFLTEVRAFLEYKIKNESNKIKNKEDIMNEPAINYIKEDIQYHNNVEKLQKYLNFKHPDIDLLCYIISCRNKKAAIQYFQASSSCLTKDRNLKKYILKKEYSNHRIKVLYWIGTIQYFGLIAASLFPTYWVFYILWTTNENINNLPPVFFGLQFILSIVAIGIAFILLGFFLKPWKAKQFLKLEKVKSPNNNDIGTLDDIFKVNKILKLYLVINRPEGDSLSTFEKEVLDNMVKKNIYKYQKIVELGEGEFISLTQGLMDEIVLAAKYGYIEYKSQNDQGYTFIKSIHPSALNEPASKVI